MKREIHARRRARLLEAIADGPWGRGMAVVPAATHKRRSNDTDFSFHQEPDFRYLTGYPEADAVAVLRPGHEEPFLLFVLPRNPEAETWTGRRFGPERAAETFGADRARPIEELEAALPDLLKGYDALYYRKGGRPALDTLIESTLEGMRARTRDGTRVPMAVVDISTVLHEQRLCKSEEEIDSLRRAVGVSAEGHAAAMRLARPGLLERDLAAALEYVFRRGGAEGAAYETIVAAGGNACILHYTELSETLREGELLLIDAGALVDGYSGDITRTFPVSGKFSSAQRRVYEVVLDAHERAIEAVRPGVPFDAPHQEAVRAITEGLVRLGILSGKIDELIAAESHKPYYMHRTGHWLGMDVHDVGKYHDGDGSHRPLEPGMVLTIEPGLYLSSDDESVPEELRGIGVRIEDDVAVTPEGREVLSADLPTDPEEIERLMSQEPSLPL